MKPEERLEEHTDMFQDRCHECGALFQHSKHEEGGFCPSCVTYLQELIEDAEYE